MEFIKIKKILEKIYKEEQKKEVKKIDGIKNFIESSYNWDIYENKSNEKFYTQKLTSKQHEKDIEKQKELIKNKTLNRLSTNYLKNLKYIELLENTLEAQEIEIEIDFTYGGVYGRQALASLWVKTCNGWKNYKGAKTTGCGYDKESTTTANAFNKSLELFVLIAKKLEKMSQKNIYNYLTRATQGRDFLGYGFDFFDGCIGSFSGGVGFSCHDSILKVLGFKRIANHYTKYNNYYKYTR